MSLAEVMDWPASEFVAWQDYHSRHGWPHDRIVWAVANAGAYTGGGMGGKARPADLIPHIETAAERRRRIMAYFDSMAAQEEVNGR